MGFIIDTYYKYSIVVLYSIFNTIFRTLHVEVLSPWLINNVQDLERKQNQDNAYEITTINTIYVWVDWVLYMNILLSQIDMVIIEIVINIISTNITTYIYLNYRSSATSMVNKQSYNYIP
jgi:hypothetical protein